MGRWYFKIASAHTTTADQVKNAWSRVDLEKGKISIRERELKGRENKFYSEGEAETYVEDNDLKESIILKVYE